VRRLGDQQSRHWDRLEAVGAHRRVGQPGCSCAAPLSANRRRRVPIVGSE
jgi:hypothetical protein